MAGKMTADAEITALMIARAYAGMDWERRADDDDDGDDDGGGLMA